MCDKEVPAVVIDVGSDTCRAGLADYIDPSVVFPSIVGRSRNHPRSIGSNKEECFVGDEAWSKMNTLKFTYPIEHSVVYNWEDMEIIWHYVYEMLQAAPEEHTVLLTDALLNPKSNRETMTEMMFEKFKTPALYLANQAKMSLYSNGRITGVVLDSGHGVTHSVPFYEGFEIHDSIGRLPLAGRDLTEYLKRMLTERGYSFVKIGESRILQKLKEKMCYVSSKFDQEISMSSEDKGYELPDGRVVNIGNETFRCPEVLFEPSLLGMEADGIDKMIYKSILKCDTNMHRHLYPNIVLAGGNTLFPGIDLRLKDGISALAPKKYAIKIAAPSNRNLSSWIGGSILASLSSFETMWISKQEYEESGPSIVHSKCN